MVSLFYKMKQQQTQNNQQQQNNQDSQSNPVFLFYCKDLTKLGIKYMSHYILVVFLLILIAGSSQPLDSRHYANR